MANILIPRWQDLENVIQQANGKVTIFAPFFSGIGIQKVQLNCKLPIDVDFWTRMSLHDWANGIADPEALRDFMALVEEEGKIAILKIQPALHAKAYFADESAALIGSSNLTRGGFDKNIEIMFRVDGENAANALESLSFSAEPKSKQITVGQLDDWIDKYSDRIHKYREDNKGSREELEEAEQESEEETTEGIVDPIEVTLQSFIQWLIDNQQYAGASDLVELNADTVVQRRQGHVKQCFAGVYRFLQFHPSWIQRLANAATDGDGVHQPNDQLTLDWSQHLLDHAADSNDLYSYMTLRGILKPNLGGTLQGAGGGGSGTLKRAWPLVAKFLTDQLRS